MKKIFISMMFIFVGFSVTLAQTPTEKMAHYWDEVDFSDTTLVNSDAFSAKVIDFLYSYAAMEDGAHFDSLSMVGISEVMGRAKVNMRVYEFLLEYLLEGYTAMGQSHITDYLLNYPQLAEGEITMVEGMRLDSISESYQKVSVGAVAPDYSGVSIDGKSYRLYESKAQRILVVFWSTDCEYCHDFLVKIRKNLDLKNDYELVTFALAEDQKEVEAAVKKMKLRGYHFYDDARWEGKAFLDYHVTSTPMVFLLDLDKTILCKPYDWNGLKYWLMKNNISF